ncbi:MAG: hypothetical protein WCJ32_06760, partial [Actinomycetota bacterium]
PDKDEVHSSILCSPTVKMIRRAILALSAAGIVAGVLRLRGKGGVPPQQGGWRELPVDPK